MLRLSSRLFFFFFFSFLSLFSSLLLRRGRRLRRIMHVLWPAGKSKTCVFLLAVLQLLLPLLLLHLI
ncbi:hypothetical protein IWX48DRAFT_598084, partial [Phyllosticta citricarpa]